MVRIAGKVSLLVVGIGALAIMASMFVFTLSVTTEVESSKQELVTQKSLQEPITAVSAYVFDLETGAYVYAKNAHDPRPIASITKLLSSAIFFEHAPSNATATIQWSDVREEGRSGRLAYGQEYQNKELLFPALLESSNDAAKTMQRVAFGDLVESMNEYVDNLGLSQTSFVDTSGLRAGNISTAHELGKLGAALYQQYPHIIDITRLEKYLNHINAWMNTSPFITEEGYKGGKHGYTYEAQKTAISFFEESLSSGQSRIIVYVLLGSSDLKADMATLRDHVQESLVFE